MRMGTVPFGEPVTSTSTSRTPCWNPGVVAHHAPVELALAQLLFTRPLASPMVTRVDPALLRDGEQETTIWYSCWRQGCVAQVLSVRAAPPLVPVPALMLFHICPVSAAWSP